MNEILRERSHGYQTVSHNDSSLSHKNHSVHVFLNIKVHQGLRVRFFYLLKLEGFLNGFEFLNEVQTTVSEKQPLNNQMMMWLSHFNLDHRSLITKKVNWLVFVSRLDFDARLRHQYVASVHALR